MRARRQLGAGLSRVKAESEAQMPPLGSYLSPPGGPGYQDEWETERERRSGLEPQGRKEEVEPPLVELAFILVFSS